MLSTKDKALSALAYFGILFFLPLVAADNQQYGKFHANQGLILFVFNVLLGIVSGILGFIPLIGWIVGRVVNVIQIIYLILGIVNGATGRMQKLPFIGDIVTLIQ